MLSTRLLQIAKRLILVASCAVTLLAFTAGTSSAATTSSSAKASSSCTTGSTGYWSGYWAYSPATQSWTWTWVWNSPTCYVTS